MEKNRHSIQRHILEIAVPSEKEYQEIQDKASSLCREVLPEILERLFNDLDIGDRVLQIPKMEIDLQNLPQNNWEETFLSRFEKQMKKQLLKKKNNARQRKPGSPVLEDESPEEHLLTSEQNIWQSFFQFLKNGDIDNQGPHFDFQEFENEIIGSLEDTGRRSEFLQGLKSLYKSQTGIIRRLAAQFSRTFLLRFADVLWDIHNSEWEKLRQAFDRFIIKEEYKTIFQKFNFSIDDVFVESTLKKLLLRVSKPDFGELQKECEIAWEEEMKNMTGRATQTTKKSETKEKKDIAKKAEKDKEEPARKKEFFIRNAGLVITAPFLINLFANLNLTEEKDFISPEAQVKAIHLTQYLATGEENAPENLLFLNKILCAWPVEETLRREIILEKETKEETDKLLEAVIKHWGKLGKSSISALRETFLQRNGKLQFQKSSGNWLLQVERKSGIDILVERLPWTISVIKLPWMKRSLFVEWV